MVVVIIEPPAHPCAQLGAGLEIVQIDALLLKGPPQPLDENVVHAAATAIHADLDIGGLQHAGEREAGELAALIGVEYLWLAVARQGPPLKPPRKNRHPWY